MTNKKPTHNTYIIPFEHLGRELSREGHWTKSFRTGIGTGNDQFTVERENFGDADSPMLTQVISDDGMRHIANTLGGWHGRRYADFASSFVDESGEYDGPYQAFMDSSEGEQVMLSDATGQPADLTTFDLLKADTAWVRGADGTWSVGTPSAQKAQAQAAASTQ